MVKKIILYPLGFQSCCEMKKMGNCDWTY